MPNKIYQSLALPLKFYLVEPADIPQYVSKHMDDWLFKLTIRDFEQDVNFVQPWLKDDSIRLQFISNFGPLTVQLRKCDGELIYSASFNTMQEDFFNPGFFVRQIEIDLTGLVEEGEEYYLVIPEAGFISNPFAILDEDSGRNTLYVEYSSTEGLYQGIIFNIPYSPAVRVPAILKYKDTASKDTVYADQNEAETILHSVPYRLWTFYVTAIPPEFKDRISRIFGCDSLKIDGRELTKSEGATWEIIDAENYPMAGYHIELREKLNRSSLIFETEVLLPGLANMMAVIDTKGFGMDDTLGGNFLEIEDVE